MNKATLSVEQNCAQESVILSVFFHAVTSRRRRQITLSVFVLRVPRSHGFAADTRDSNGTPLRRSSQILAPYLEQPTNQPIKKEANDANDMTCSLFGNIQLNITLISSQLMQTAEEVKVFG